jgi:hypothetical protein
LVGARVREQPWGLKSYLESKKEETVEAEEKLTHRSKP